MEQNESDESQNLQVTTGIITRSQTNNNSQISDGNSHSMTKGSEFTQRVWNKFHKLQEAKANHAKIQSKAKKGKIKNKDVELNLQGNRQGTGQEESNVSLDYDDILVEVQASEDEFQSDEELEDEVEPMLIKEPSQKEKAVKGNKDSETLSEFLEGNNELDSEIEFNAPGCEQVTRRDLITDKRIVLPESDIEDMVQQLVQKKVRESLDSLLEQGVVMPGTSKASEPMLRRKGDCIAVQSDLGNCIVDNDVGVIETVNKRPVPMAPPPIKSPSDTTIYAPLLQKRRDETPKEIIDQISNFVEC